MSTSTCPFCLKTGFEQHKLLFRTDNVELFSIYRTDNFIVVPDIAPLIEGHLLIIPITHYLCCGAALQEHSAELAELKAFITHVVQTAYGDCMFIEHGAAQDLRAGNSIDHAHLHCLPADIDITVSSNELGVWEQLYSFLELCTFSTQNKAYLFYENTRGRKYVHVLDKSKVSLPSQYLRKSFADGLGSKWWDWREMIHDSEYRSVNSKRILDGVKKIRKFL